MKLSIALSPAMRRRLAKLDAKLFAAARRRLLAGYATLFQAAEQEFAAVVAQISPAMRRQLAVLSGVALCGSILALFASYLSGALFLVLNKLDPRQAGLTSIGEYWTAYSDRPDARKKLLASIALSSAGAFVILPAAVASAVRPRRLLHGDARFATPAEVRRSGLVIRPNDPAPRILVGRYGGRFLGLRGQLSVMLSAPTRSGKGVGVVIPNLLSWPDSVVVLDIKGENYEVTSGYRAKCGQKVYAFSPFDELARSHRWNPLSAVRPDPLHRIGDLLSIGQVFFASEGLNTSAEAFFNDQARNLFLGLGLLLLESPDLPRTMGEMLRQSSGQGRPLKDHLTTVMRARSSSTRPLSAECLDALQRLTSNSENTLSSIVATFNAPLLVFADAIVDAATSADDFRFSNLRRERISIYVRIPPNRLATARPLLNLFFSQLVYLNTQTLPEQDASLKVQCLLVQDEFTSMGRIGVVSSAAAFLAGYDLRLLTIVQAMSQLDAVYGDKEARTFATNHGLQILYAPREQRDADEYSAMLGHFTERAVSRGRSRSLGPHGHTTVSRNESQQRRALLLPQEFKELGAERQVLIKENCKPILADKIRYHREPAFRERLRPPPEVPAMDMDLHFARTRNCIRLIEELGPDDTVDVDRLAFDPDALDSLPKELNDQQAEGVCDLFYMAGCVVTGGQPAGCAIERAAPEKPAMPVNPVTAE